MSGREGRGEGRGGEGRTPSLSRRHQRRPPSPRLLLPPPPAQTAGPTSSRSPRICWRTCAVAASSAAAGGGAHRPAGSLGPCRQPRSRQSEQRHCLGVVGGCPGPSPSPGRAPSLCRGCSARARVLSSRAAIVRARHRRHRARISYLGRKKGRGGHRRDVWEGRGRGGEGRTPSLSRRRRRRPPHPRLLLSPPPAQTADPTSSHSPRIS